MQGIRRNVFMGWAGATTALVLTAGCGPEDSADGLIEDEVGQTVEGVIGGTNASPGEYPWQAQLAVPGYAHWCGGSLLNNRWVLTAAHCVDGFVSSPGSVTVTMGELDRDVNEGREQVRTGQRVILHPNFDPSTLENDIALIELSSSVTLNAWVQPVRLAANDFSVGANSVVTGWGWTSSGGSSASDLQEASLPIVANGVCDAEPSLSLSVTDSMICAGFEPGIRGGCHGDSGGPLVTRASDGAYEQVGIVSWGRGYYCDTYTVFTRVTHFTSWIDAQISGATKPCIGQTAPGYTDWKPYGSDGLYLDVDTSACGYTQTPLYFTSMGGTSHQWRGYGVTSIYQPTATGFRVFIKNGSGAITPATANARKWHLNWQALPRSLRQSTLCTGQTTPGFTNWQPYNGQGVYVDIDASACGFTWSPQWMTSIGGNVHHWNTSGATSLYQVTPNGFRIYVFDRNGAITPAIANQRRWHINWQGRNQSLSDYCLGNSVNNAWQQYNTNGIYMDVNTSACGLSGVPQFFTQFYGWNQHWKTSGITAIYRPSPTGFRVYIHDDNGPVTPALAAQRGWRINWGVRR